MSQNRSHPAVQRGALFWRVPDGRHGSDQTSRLAVLNAKGCSRILLRTTNNRWLSPNAVRKRTATQGDKLDHSRRPTDEWMPKYSFPKRTSVTGIHARYSTFLLHPSVFVLPVFRSLSPTCQQFCISGPEFRFR